MRKYSYSLCFLVLLIISCNAPMEEENIETWWINSAKVECEGVGPMSCFQVQSNETLDPEGWTLHYAGIKGFNYEPGNIYQIKVKVTDRPEPIPADASSKIYELVEVISSEPDPALRLTNIYKVTSVGEFTDPTNPNSGEALTFEFNATDRNYFGNMGCNTVRGGIKVNDGKNLELNPGMVTLMACENMELENAVSQALINTRSYELGEEGLQFFNEDGEVVITFMPVD